MQVFGHDRGARQGASGRRLRRDAGGHALNPAGPPRSSRRVAPHRGAPARRCLAHPCGDVRHGHDAHPTPDRHRHRLGSRAQHGHGLGQRPGAVRRAASITPGTVNLIELTEPYRSRISHGTDRFDVEIPLEELALPQATIRNAGAGIAASPVHQVFAHHLLSLARQAPRLEGDGSSALLGTATIALARALICSAAEDSRRLVDAMADSLLVRVQTYVQAHLTDPGLSPERIAAAHHVSVRQLYRTFAEPTSGSSSGSSDCASRVPGRSSPGRRAGGAPSLRSPAAGASPTRRTSPNGSARPTA